jgi:LacI family transcriptional regulator
LPTVSTISDVARKACVSTTTVSRVLNNNPTVDPRLAAKVQKAIELLNYSPSRVARSLRTRRSNFLALIISDIRNPFFADIVKGVEDVAYSADYSLVLCNAEDDPVKWASYLDLALAEHAVGVIVTPATCGADVSTLLGRGVPVVAADRRLNNHDVDCVVMDNVRGAKQAVSHLIEGGYERIACITGSLETTTATERFAGYRLALAEAGVGLDDSLVRTGQFCRDGAHAAMRSLLSLSPRPDAVFVDNNIMTLEALHAIAEAGLSIPDDIGIVGFDDMSWASLLRPPLTTVAQPSYDIGVETARLLMSRIAGYSGVARTVTLLPSLVVRKSSTPKASGTQSADEQLGRAGARRPRSEVGHKGPRAFTSGESRLTSPRRKGSR